MKCLSTACLVLMGAMWIACGQYGQTSYTPPDLASGTSNLVIDDQPLEAGEQRDGNLPGSGRYLGYVFQARSGEVYDITLERMSDGDVPALALYRFAGGNWSDCLAWATADARRIAVGGWQVQEGGTYLVLVDLVSGSGSSSFILLLSCTSGCSDPVTCASNADCPAGQVCFEGLCLEGGMECQTDADCLPHEVCQENFCVLACNPRPEVCDGLDNDCDGHVDEGCGQLPCASDADCPPREYCLNGYCQPLCGCATDADCPAGFLCIDCQCVSDSCPDEDGDGFGSCVDCNDSDATVFPAAAEICNGRDDDCDGVVDEGCSELPCTADVECAAGEICWEGSCMLPCRMNSDCPAGQVCVAGVCQPVQCQDNDADGFADCDGDCDDADASVNPAAAEVCDGLDNNCDGQVDEGC